MFKTKFNKLFFSFFFIALTANVVLFSQNCMADEWVAPSSAKGIANPFKNDESILPSGKKIFVKRCEGCHGSKGAGDGPDAADLSIEPAKLTDKSVKEQTDGELFWKLKTGKKPMPKYDNRLTDDEIWQVVSYLKGLQ